MKNLLMNWVKRYPATTVLIVIVVAILAVLATLAATVNTDLWILFGLFSGSVILMWVILLIVEAMEEWER